MNKEEFKEFVIEQINKSFNEKTGSNEAIDDAAYYIAEKFFELSKKLWLDGWKGYDEPL